MYGWLRLSLNVYLKLEHSSIDRAMTNPFNGGIHYFTVQFNSLKHLNNYDLITKHSYQKSYLSFKGRVTSFFIHNT